MNKSPASPHWLSWRSALYLYLGLAILDIWMLWVTPVNSPFHWLGFAGFVIMPLAFLALGKAGHQEGSAIQPVLLALMGFAGYANTIFTPSFKEWFFTSTWGVGSFYVPPRTVYPFGMSIHSNQLITVHASSALLLAGLITLQWIVMLRKRRTAETIQWHRRVGAFTVIVVLPVMAVSSFLCSIYVLRTPFNQLTYAVLPLIITGCLITSVRGAIAGKLEQHVDYSYSAFIVLCSAAIYRFVCLFIWLYRGSYTTSDQVPVDGAGILTYLVVIALIVIPFAILGRLKQNLFPVMTLASVLIFSMMFVPWRFYGAPESANFLKHLSLF